MTRHTPFPLSVGAALAALFCAGCPVAHSAQPNTPAAKTAPLAPHAAQHQAPKPQQRDTLAQWLENHSNLPLPELQQKLAEEPGFRDLPAENQQKLRDRLTELYYMSPARRAEILDRNAALMKLPAAQQKRYHAAVTAAVSLPPDRRRLVARAVIDLREMPPQERQAVIASQRFREQFSESERSILADLLSAEPYHPDSAANRTP